jgi:hypothetical protein
MLGLVLIYWIGRKFYDLAARYNRSEWAWAIIGVVIYYAAQIVFGVIIYVAFPEMSESTMTGLNYFGILVGGGVWYAALTYFEKKWENESYQTYESDDSSIEEIGKELKGD